MRNKIACAVSDVLSEPVLHKSVKTWYKRAGEEIQESIAAPDEDGTVHISVSCRRLDSIECFHPTMAWRGPSACSIQV
jgi:hypothetical protein